MADDRSSLIPALKHYYPKAHIQLCQNHYIENIRQLLHIRTDGTHHHFFHSLCQHVFKEYTDDKHLNDALHHLLTKRAENDPQRQSIVMDIHWRRKELFAYTKVPHCPANTNLIELYNSHLNGQLKTIKGFKSFQAATRWLNAYLIRRRTKTFTDCEMKFKKLNGKTSLEMTLKNRPNGLTYWVSKRPKKHPKPNGNRSAFPFSNSRSIESADCSKSEGGAINFPFFQETFQNCRLLFMTWPFALLLKPTDNQFNPP